MCIKCGCGKKMGQPGYGMGKAGAKTPVKKVTKRVAKKATITRKRGM
jgi:hypothetical protein